MRFYKWTLIITTTAIPKKQIKLIKWNLLESKSFIWIHRILIHWIITYGIRCSKCTNVTHQSQPATYLDINWWKIQQNMSYRFREILVFLKDCFLQHQVCPQQRHTKQQTISLVADCCEVVTSEAVGLSWHQQLYDLLPCFLLRQRNIQSLHKPSPCSFVNLLWPTEITREWMSTA